MGLLILSLSCLMGYIWCDKYKKAFICADFLERLAKKLIHDYRYEMQGIARVFYNEYTLFFNEEVKLEDAGGVLEYIKNSLLSAELSEEYLVTLNKFLSSGAEELDESAKQLTEAAKNNRENAQKRYSEIGKSLLLLFPAVSLIFMILLL